MKKNIMNVWSVFAVIVIMMLCLTFSAGALSEDVQLFNEYLKGFKVSDTSLFPGEIKEGVFSALIEDLDNDGDCEMVTFDTKSYFSITMKLYEIVDGRVVFKDSVVPDLITTGQNALINTCAFLDDDIIRFQGHALLYGGSAEPAFYSSYRISNGRFVKLKEFHSGGRGTVSKPFYYKENVSGRSYTTLQEYNNAVKAAGFVIGAHTHIKEQNAKVIKNPLCRTAQCFKGNHIFSFVKVASFYFNEIGTTGTVHGFLRDNTSFFTSPKCSVTSEKNSVKITWEPLSAAYGYRVFRKSGGNWVALSTGSPTSYTAKNLMDGTKYDFAVMGYTVIDGKVVWAPEYTTINTATQTVAPTKITAAQNTSAIKLTWTACPGATGYRIFFKVNGSWNTCLSATTKTSHTFAGLPAGTTYTFAVRPYTIAGGAVIWSNFTEYTAATLPLAPTVRAVSTAKGKANVNWSAVNGAEAYQVYYRMGNGSYKLFKPYTDPQNLNFTLYSNTKYTFAVRAAKRTSAGWVYGAFTFADVTVK